MSRLRFLLRSLIHFWQTNLAILLGVIAATTVIAGSLIVGDSVRESLRIMSLDRLGHVDHALVATRFFRQELAETLSQHPSFKKQFTQIAPALIVPGSLEFQSKTGTSRAGHVTFYGVEESFAKLMQAEGFQVPGDLEIIINQRVAEQLAVSVGDQLTLWTELPSAVPRETLLGNRNETSAQLILTVASILPDEMELSRFSMHPGQQIPLVGFVSLKSLQDVLNLGRERDRELRRIIPPRINTLFVSASEEENKIGSEAKQASETLSQMLKESLSLIDLGLNLREEKQGMYFSLESDRMIVEESLSNVALQTAKVVGYSTSEVFVYLANEIRNPSRTEAEDAQQTGYSMYSVVAGLNFPLLEPFGPFTFQGANPKFPLKENEILLNDWLAKDLHVQTGDFVELLYHQVGSHGELPELVKSFQVAGIIDFRGTPADDRQLTPYVKGITDVEDFGDWKQLFPMKEERITPRDDEYWDDFRATPKAFLPLEHAQSLWESRYGNVTSLRMANPNTSSLKSEMVNFEKTFLQQITPTETGLQFQPVKYQGVEAAKGTTDFTGLFIGFSFFLILSAMILIGLFIRLNIERRIRSVGLMSAVGFTMKRIRNLFLQENLLLVLLGAVIGLFTAIQYAELMIHGLKTWWIGAIGTPFLNLHVTPLSLGIGFAIAILVALLTLWWSVRLYRNASTRALLLGDDQALQEHRSSSHSPSRSLRRGQICIGTAVLLLVALLTKLVPASEAFSGLNWQTVLFFLVGFLLLCGSLFLFSWSLQSDRKNAVQGSSLWGTARLGLRNASRHRSRSLLTVGLISFATFVIVAVAAGHRNPAVEQPLRESGNGGFLLIGESSTPILSDLNTEKGRNELDFEVQNESAEKLLEKTTTIPFRYKQGENASCLNLYQTALPTILGVPRQMVKRGGFRFAGVSRENPWELLQETDDAGTIPVLGDMNSLMYSLHKGVGDTISIPDEENPDYVLRIVGMFDGSPFQGMLLMSEENFISLYPELSGYRYFLIDAPLEEKANVSQLLETGLGSYGFDVDGVADRLASFLSVQNTYLLTFQTLGGLGLLLGTLGLATVMLRNVLERRSELALMRALGFVKSSLSWMILWENAFLLCLGLLIGTVSALLAMSPHLVSVGADIDFKVLLLMLGGVLIVGMFASLFAVREASRTPILSTLRSE